MRVALPTFSPAERRILSENASRHDLPNRIMKALEETLEYATALNRLHVAVVSGKPYRKQRNQAANEFADVQITTYQLGLLMKGFFNEISEELHSEMLKMKVRLEFEDRGAQSEPTPWDQVVADITKHADAIESVIKCNQLPDAVSTHGTPEPDFKPHYAEPVCKDNIGHLKCNKESKLGPKAPLLPATKEYNFKPHGYWESDKITGRQVYVRRPVHIERMGME